MVDLPQPAGPIIVQMQRRRFGAGTAVEHIGLLEVMYSIDHGGQSDSGGGGGGDVWGGGGEGQQTTQRATLIDL